MHDSWWVNMYANFNSIYLHNSLSFFWHNWRARPPWSSCFHKRGQFECLILARERRLGKMGRDTGSNDNNGASSACPSPTPAGRARREQATTNHASIDNLSRKERLANGRGHWPCLSPASISPVGKQLVTVTLRFNYGLMCVWLIHALRVPVLTAGDRRQWHMHVPQKPLSWGIR
jgi:hypothetical protein